MPCLLAECSKEYQSFISNRKTLKEEFFHLRKIGLQLMIVSPLINLPIIFFGWLINCLVNEMLQNSDVFNLLVLPD